MLGKMLGKGSDGEVYEMDDNFCVKYIKPKFCGIENYLECYIMLNIDHPNIVKAEDIEVTEYDVVKIVQKKAISNLSNRTKNKKDILAQIVDGLKFLTKHDIVHGDIKPSNILRYKDGAVKINDLSLCRFLESNSKKQLYTFHYRAPEIDKGGISIKSDVYALGCTMYEIYFNESYHDKSLNARVHIKKRITDANRIFLDLIYKMTEEDVIRRYDIDQVCGHEYFGKHKFGEYKQVRFDNYEILKNIASQMSLSDTFVKKCMNEKFSFCTDYKQVDAIVSNMKFDIFDYIFKNEN
jgi:serine/threonine protein kinase